MTWEDGEPTMEPVYTPKLEALLGPGAPPRGSPRAAARGIAASLQVVFEEAAFHVLRALHTRTGLGASASRAVAP